MLTQGAIFVLQIVTNKKPPVSRRSSFLCAVLRKLFAPININFAITNFWCS